MQECDLDGVTRVSRCVPTAVGLIKPRPWEAGTALDHGREGVEELGQPRLACSSISGTFKWASGCPRLPVVVQPLAQRPPWRHPAAGQAAEGQGVVVGGGALWVSESEQESALVCACMQEAGGDFSPLCWSA